MSESTWPAPTPRDEMLARVVTRGRRIQMVNRLVIGLVVAGVVTAGAVGVALGTSGAIDLFDDGAAPATVESGAVEYRSCPDGAVLGRLRGGDRVFLTGRDESGAWMEVRSPVDQVERVWVRADVVDPDATVDLPVAGCEGAELTATGPGVVVTTSTTSTTVEGEEPAPEETTTTTAAPGPTPTQPPGPGPTTPTTQPPPPDTSGPTINALNRTNAVIRGSGEFCSPGLPASTVVSASVSDPSGLQAVEVRWSFLFAGALRSGSLPMSHAGGGVYSATLDFSHLGGSQALVNINWSVRAVDTKGNQRTVGSGPNNAVELQGC